MMKLLSKTMEKGKKYIRVLGVVKIPYETEQDGYKKTLHIGPVKIPYEVDAQRNKLCLNVLGMRIPFSGAHLSRRYQHYQIRDELTTARKQELLEKEMEPLLGYKPDLNDPKTFNEKILWSKLHIENPLITTCCDKYAVKEYAAKIIGEEYVLPVLGAWDNAADIDFDKLPNQFALKVNWSSGFNIIVKDKSQLDCEEARRRVAEWMKPEQNSYYDSFNWGYKHMKPVAFAEPYIEQIDGQVYDYKFYFTNGRFIYLFIATDRHGDHTLTYTFYDDKFEYMPFTYGHKNNANPHPEMPKNLDKMLELARKLAEPFPFVRVDFYEVGDRVYLGEMTFYSGGGMLPFEPIEWDRKLGDLIEMPADMPKEV